MHVAAAKSQLKPALVLLFVWAVLSVSLQAADEPPSFFRGLNLNGPAVTIDGHVWEGRESKTYQCDDKAFENQQVKLIPPTDSDRAAMIRSSRWGGNRVELTAIPPGAYTLFLYVWEDNDAETYSVSVNQRRVLERYNSGRTGQWMRLGPWPVRVRSEGTILITSQGGTANFSGIELWRGTYDGLGPAPTAEELAFFEKRIRPLLANKCYECHSQEAAEVEGGLLVDSRATIQRGGVGGPAVVPGNVAESLLVEAVRYENDAMQMPPDGKLSDEEIADLEKWINMGAPDPRTTATKHAGKQIDVASARQFWSLAAITTPQIPQVQNTDWPRTDIDRFVLAKLEEHGLAPSVDADRRVLIRRATYDLIGLPPTPEEVDAFLQDNAPDAFSRVIERLLNSPRYGERWGRHWLDVVRYADTAGDNSDYPIPQIYRYRDWVIEAFNRDQPYDEFVRDQLAGDLRGGRDEQQRLERIIATGYLANARRFGSRVADYPQHLTIEDTIDNLGRAFLGMTLSCARCHDHKFDPITNHDYYALYGIFHSTRYPWPGIELDKKQRDFIPLVAPDQLADMQQAWAARNKRQAQLDKEVETLKKALKNASQDDSQQIAQKLKAAQEQAQAHRDLPPLFETAYAVADAATCEDVAIQLKGDPARPGDIVPRRFLTVLGGQTLPPETEASGREQLAEWILADDNPLTARVMANRIWQHHFGRGLVATPNDFGKQGQPPTHPELLDYLAQQFRAGGWSIKSMHRLIMGSRTYQQASEAAADSIAEDPTDQWLARFPRLRLDAEALRDTLLAHAGNLDLSPAGPHPFPPADSFDFTQHKPFKAVYETNHRSVYLMTQRIQRHPFLAIFDGADPSTSTAARMTTTTPLQALFLLNDPLVHEQSARVAERILRHAADDRARIEFAYQLLFARPPTPAEHAAVRDFLANAQSLLHSEGRPQNEIDAEVWRASVRSLFRLNEFVYLD